MKIELPEKVKFMIRTLKEHGHDAYAVGGCVRDAMLLRVPADWDITTSAKPPEIKAIFPRTVDTGILHGTVTVMLGQEGFEVTTYRIDGEYEDARHPKEVFFTADLLEDLKRRDFTINAMAYNDEAGLVDAFDGAGDLKRGVIRCVGEPADRFGEDALRMLRAVRFAAQLGFAIEGHTREAITELAPTIGRVSAERIQAELVKLLVSDHPEKMRDVYDMGLSAVFLPEFDRMMETPQNTPHHCYTVGEHTIRAICGIRPDKCLRLAMLLHDVAKPACRKTDESGRDHFYGHPAHGSEVAAQILHRLKFDNATIATVKKLIELHDDRPELGMKAVRKAMRRNGTDVYPALFEVKRADTMAQSAYRREEKLAYIDRYEALVRKVKEEGNCVTIKDLAVNGRDLIEAGFAPGKGIGAILEGLLERVIEDPSENTKENLLKQAHKLANSGV